METLRGSSILPRRLTKLFAETRLSYERNLNVAQTQYDGPELSSLHLNLRIQKDRLLAWGLEWSDANAAQAVDLDGSLDRAGISDLVASIMSSIREQLDEAESLQSPMSLDTPATFADMKPRGKSSYQSPWTPESLKRLEGILKDLTVSIDTLCDLSRPRVEDWKKRNLHQKADGMISSDDFSPAPSEVFSTGDLVSSQSTTVEGLPPTWRDNGLIRSSRIDARCIRQAKPATGRSNALPPSYESVAAGSEHSVLAYRMTFDLSSKSENLVGQSPVLLDYGQVQGYKTKATIDPDCPRYEELFLGLRRLPAISGTYSGILRLGGWTVDQDGSRCAYVYELPNQLEPLSSEKLDIQPRTLLSFLQNGADTDGANMPSLENRYRLAYNLVSSVLRMHSAGISHRDLNSNNIVFFLDSTNTTVDDKPWKGPILRKPYLTGFHQSPSKVPTVELVSPFSNIYHHPQIGGGKNDPYIFAHDYYSLGLIMLEIGLWMPLGKFWKSKYTRNDFKLRLQNIYLKKLSAKCGSRYMRAALYCMTAADSIGKGNMHTEGTTRQASHVLTSETDFTVKVVESLERCCMIDDDDDNPIHSAHHTYSTKVDKLHQSSMETHLAHETPETQASGLILKVPEIHSTKHNEVMSKRRSKREEPKQVLSRPSKIKVWSHEIPSLYTKYWASTMFPKLEHILSRAISRWETYTIDIFMAGQEPDSARPTIYLECTSTEKVRKILRHLNKDLRLFDIKVVSGHIVRSKAGKKKRKKLLKNTQISRSGVESRGPEDDMARKELNPFYQPFPSCGASIGACSNGKHLPPVTFGGAIMVNGEPYGMSVHHMLEDDDELDLGLCEINDFQRSVASPKASVDLQDPKFYRSPTLQVQEQSRYPESGGYSEDDLDDLSEGCDGSEYSTNLETTDQGSQALYPFEISEDEEDEAQVSTDDDEFWLSVDFENQLQIRNDEGDTDEHAELGDTLGIDAGHGRHFSVTQPAIDDVDHDFFTTDEDMDEEHLSSHGFGHIHASSGIKRSRRDDIIHEIDWALIKINETRMLAHNIVQGGGRYCRLAETIDSASANPCKAEKTAASDTNSYPCQVMKAKDLGGLQVHAFGRTSGLQTGMILPAMRMVRMPGRSFASHSWHVKGNFGGMVHSISLSILLSNKHYDSTSTDQHLVKPMIASAISHIFKS